MLVLVVPATAAPPERNEINPTFFYADVERGLVIFVNTTRDQYCTPDVVAFELALARWLIDFEEWLEGGEVGPEPPFPDEPAGGFPEGEDPLREQLVTTRKGAVIVRMQGRNVTTEIWQMIEDAPLVGPCTDTDPADDPLYVGTSSVTANDNDLFVSGTRGNAFGSRLLFRGQDADGNAVKYTRRFHVNDRCRASEDAPPACLIETSYLRTHG
jgi:hypothetical protein